MSPKATMRGVLTILLVVAFEAILLALFVWPVPKENTQLVTYMIGQLSGFAGAGVIFYLGSSQGSVDKSAALTGMLSGRMERPPLDLTGAELPRSE